MLLFKVLLWFVCVCVLASQAGEQQLVLDVLWGVVDIHNRGNHNSNDKNNK